MENELIRRSATAKDLRAYAERKAQVNGIEYANGILAAACRIEQSIPSVDAVEVRHGKWMFDGEDWFCNRCGHNALCEKDTGEQVLSIVCPNCCVRMDG